MREPVYKSGDMVEYRTRHMAKPERALIKKVLGIDLVTNHFGYTIVPEGGGFDIVKEYEIVGGENSLTENQSALEELGNKKGDLSIANASDL